MYRLTEAQQEIVQRIGKLADEAIAPEAGDVDKEARFPRSSLDALGKAGFLGLTVPEDLGGMGQSLRTAAAAIDEVAQR